MDFRIEQRIVSRVDEVARAYVDREMYASLGELPKVGTPEVLGCEVEGDRAQLRIQYHFTGHLPAAALAVLDPKKLTWVEESTHDLAAHDVRWLLVPDHYRDRFRANGTYRFRADGDIVVREAKGDLVVRTPFVGRVVERAIVSGLREHLAAEAPLVEAWLAARRR
ncbi:MAG: DUF2505 family protein [Acidimicrobiales bacterium]